MAKEMKKCELCENTVDSSTLTSCKGCGKKYCPECQSQSTNQKYCRECVGLSGIVTHK